MKLYAKVNNRRGKMEGVGDDEMINIELILGNKYLYHIYFTLETLLVSYGKQDKFINNHEKGNKLKGDEQKCNKCGMVTSSIACPNCKTDAHLF